ncbi:peptide chain release factor 1 [Candidatus Profftia sp. (ex Adelges kitamiensis)]|uniref:peptide chain release factor 1 n=1 Tax=Candidatus Profftia sp. (ex Adelges kitamiensis) TaxID=2864218 RepID=UPI001CE264E0|nr:peptide chain release factor 1 [Candidatus Profftia sp. (ex Adelges kitamiensis)]
MKPVIIAKLESLQERYTEVKVYLEDSNIINNQSYFRKLSCEYAYLNQIINFFQIWKQIKKDIYAAEIMLNEPDIKEMAQEEIIKGKKYILELEQQIHSLLLPNDPNDKRNCYLEIRAGTGGDEAALFAGNMFRMYSRYAESHNWTIEVLNTIPGDHGGFKEIITKVIGNNVYGYLKFESGGHRVQRIPATETQGRIHTSTCTVAVMPEIPITELPDINPEDLRIDTFRSSGAGGQHVNTTDSAIRITHIPTRIVVECQDERSQHKNKAKALSILGARIRKAEITRLEQEKASTRRNLLGSGERSDRNRTYNFQQGRITDHRINLTIYCLDEVMEGKLDILIESILKEHKNDQLISIYENTNAI